MNVGPTQKSSSGSVPGCFVAVVQAPAPVIGLPNSETRDATCRMSCMHVDVWTETWFYSFPCFQFDRVVCRGSGSRLIFFPSSSFLHLAHDLISSSFPISLRSRYRARTGDTLSSRFPSFSVGGKGSDQKKQVQPTVSVEHVSQFLKPFIGRSLLSIAKQCA